MKTLSDGKQKNRKFSKALTITLIVAAIIVIALLIIFLIKSPTALSGNTTDNNNFATEIKNETQCTIRGITEYDKHLYLLLTEKIQEINPLLK